MILILILTRQLKEALEMTDTTIITNLCLSDNKELPGYYNPDDCKPKETLKYEVFDYPIVDECPVTGRYILDKDPFEELHYQNSLIEHLKYENQFITLEELTRDFSLYSMEELAEDIFTNPGGGKAKDFQQTDRQIERIENQNLVNKGEYYKKFKDRPKMKVYIDAEWISDVHELVGANPNCIELLDNLPYKDCKNVPICVQFHVASYDYMTSFIVWNFRVLQLLDIPFQRIIVLTEEITGRKPILSNFEDGDEFLTTFLEALNDYYPDELIDFQKDIDLIMFFSPKDLEYSIGWYLFKHNLREGYISKKRGMTGKFKAWDDSDSKPSPKVNIVDLAGLTIGGLKKFGEVLNYEMTSKSGLDSYKTDMFTALNFFPHTFINYSLGDVTDLQGIHRAKLESENNILTEVLELPDTCKYTLDTLKKTTGSLVANAVEKCIIHKAVETDEDNTLYLAYIYCLHRIGTLKKGNGRTSFITHLHQLLKKSITSLDEFESFLCRANKKFNKGWLELKTYKDTKSWKKDFDRWNKLSSEDMILSYADSKYWDYSAYSMNTMKYWAEYVKTTSIYNAVVQGGRCVNECPELYRDEYIADIDLKSAYATKLRTLQFPIGRPRTIGFSNNQTHIKLREVIHRLKLGNIRPQDGLIQIVVDGTLKFNQDLIMSKAVTKKEIVKQLVEKPGKDEFDISHIQGDYNLLTNEIVGGIITLDLWELIIKIATNSELKQLLDLEVRTVCWYDAQDFCDTPKEWIEKVLVDKGELTSDGDTRTNAFFNFPLEKVFGTTVNTRNNLKSEMKATEDLTIKGVLNAKQEALKLFNNTGYGVLASPYFRIGNTLLANIITSTIRTNAWLMSKPLNIHQIITDGGFYGLEKVYKLDPSKDRNRKPGLAKLSNLPKLVQERTISLAKLGGLNWRSIFDNVPNTLKESKELSGANLDGLAWQHIKDFWQHYGIDETNHLDFQIEHKAEHTAYSVAWWNKADYALHLVFQDKDTEFLYKIRGARMGDDVPQTMENEVEDLKELLQSKSSPKYRILYNILKGDDTFPQDLEYEHKTILSASRWTYCDSFANDDTYADIRAIRPGDELVENRVYQQNNTHIRTSDYSTYQKRQKRKQKKVDLFEKKSKTISGIHKKMLADSLR